MNKPNYRIKVQIVDETTGENVVSTSDAIYTTVETTIEVARRALRQFGDDQVKFESIHYPVSEADEKSS